MSWCCYLKQKELLLPFFIYAKWRLRSCSWEKYQYFARRGYRSGKQRATKRISCNGRQCIIGPGVKIVGFVKIRNNVAIGANAVVAKDVPDNAVVTGISAKIISMNGSTGYINRTI